MSTARMTIAGAELFAALAWGNSVEPPEEYWVGLCLASPTISSTGEELVEPNDPGVYARASIPNNAGAWATDSNLQRYNTTTLLFPSGVGVAGSDWGLIKHWALCSDDEGGLVYLFGELITPLDVNPGDQVSVGPGALAIAMNVLYQVP